MKVIIINFCFFWTFFVSCWDHERQRTATTTREEKEKNIQTYLIEAGFYFITGQIDDKVAVSGKEEHDAVARRNAAREPGQFADDVHTCWQVDFSDLFDILIAQDMDVLRLELEQWACQQVVHVDDICTTACQWLEKAVSNIDDTDEQGLVATQRGAVAGGHGWSKGACGR